MNDEEMKTLTAIHHNIFPKREKSFEKLSFSYFNKVKAKAKCDTILSKTKEVLDYFNRTDYDLSTWFVEFQQRNCGFEKKVKRTFDWHRDDHATIGYKVYTVIFYLRKDETIKGGNLEYKLGKQTYTQKTGTGDVVCFNGSIYHRPEVCSGMGCRDSIVVFVARK